MWLGVTINQGNGNGDTTSWMDWWGRDVNVNVWSFYCQMAQTQTTDVYHGGFCTITQSYPGQPHQGNGTGQLHR